MDWKLCAVVWPCYLPQIDNTSRDLGKLQKFLGLNSVFDHSASSLALR